MERGRGGRRGGARMVRVFQKYLNSKTRLNERGDGRGGNYSNNNNNNSSGGGYNIPNIQAKTLTNIKDSVTTQVRHIDRLTRVADDLEAQFLEKDLRQTESFGESREELITKIKEQDEEIKQLRTILADKKRALETLKANYGILVDTNTLQISSILSFSRDYARKDIYYEQNKNANSTSSFSLIPPESII